jgi:succinate dehydrogenase/fumarate reductase iron-sulfur protein
MEHQNILKVRVYRFDPSVDKQPYYKDYEVPFQFEKMKVLDVLRYIQEKLDYTLSFTWDCRLWSCGLCGVSVNKRPCSACLTDVKSVVFDNSLLIEPLPNYSVIKDLVIDRTVEVEQMRKVGIEYDRNKGEFSIEKIPEVMDPEEVAFFRDWYLACIDCLVCNSACPAFSTQWEFMGPHLSVRIAKYLAHPTDEGNRAKQGYEGGIFRCLNCRRCDVVCPIALDVSSKTMERLKSEAVEKGYTPPPIRDFLENVYKFGNPWGMSPLKRAKWAEELEVFRFDSQKHDFLLYVGDTGSYDTRAQEATKSLTKLLLKAQLSFGILGKGEISDGNEVNRIGEKGLFEEIAQKNIKTFNSLKVRKIITLSPHAYNTFKNEYPSLGGHYEVVHYTHLLRDLIHNNKLNLMNNANSKVTFHDSCFLGRYNNEYDTPRDILKAIPGLELIEMERIKENSFCCGGGGGNFVTGLDEGKQRPNMIRIKEAWATGAEIVAVTCPKCLVMFEDAIKAENLEENIVVKDISELLLESLADL